MFKPLHAQVVWKESFSVPGKGVMGGENGTIESDFIGVNSWTLEYTSVELFNSDDYAKTVTTSGGRFEARDINGEVTWRSEWINIEGLENVVVELISAETGSGANASTKYMNVFYRLDEGEEVSFSENGANAGNWGTLKARQEGLKGNLLQVVCCISTHYAADKVILDEVVVRNEPELKPPVNPFDVVINELMTDPYPPEGLPDVEYIELYNKCNYTVYAENWELRINGVGKKLQNIFLESDGYILLCATGSLDSLKPYGGVSNVPGFQGLLNKGAVVEILNEKGVVIDRIAYSDSWFGDDEKKKGGWSLERIDPQRSCNQPDNWSASIHPEGGTPGSKNSVFGENSDNSSPFVKYAVAVSSNEVEVTFSEPIDTVALIVASNYSIHEIGNPDAIIKLLNEKILLHFPINLQENEIYSLTITGLTDECSNALIDKQYEVQWNFIEPGDVLVNEILFDPFPGGDDFVEIFNKSEKLINLKRLMLANRNKEKELNQVYELTPESEVLLPGEFLVLTKDTNAIFPWYSIQCPQCFLQMNRVPSFPNDQGDVVLLNEEMTIIDEFTYRENIHSPFLADTEGISLERVSLSEPANAYNNWHSAAQDAGYATPGYKNSQAGGGITGKPVVVFEPDAFSPNYDGYNDEYLISYELAKPGYVANLKIFDANGRFIRHFLKNETLGTSGKLKWNGEDETGQLLPVGVYVVMLELFNAEGEVYRFKDGVVLTGVME